MKGGWIFLIILLLLVVGGYGGWVVYSRIQAKRLGLPPPSLNPFSSSSSSSGAGNSNFPAPAPGGIKGWIDSQVRRFKNRNNRYAAGAYEESNYAGPGGRGRGAGHRLDPDEAWDSRVGNEAYYEEQELGLHAPGANTSYQSSNPYGAPSPGFAPEPERERERGRSRTREYDDSLHAERNPFGDENAASLRGVSPRPLDQAQDTSYGGATGAPSQQKKHGDGDSSPTESTRRSVFHENM